MEESHFKELVKKIKEVDKIIKTLDPAIREASFKILQEYVTGRKTSTEPIDSNAPGDDIFTQYTHDKPADNLLLITAHHYSLYGKKSFSIEEVREKANEVGITIPERPNDTIRMAARKSKKLFTNTGRGKYKPTVHGEQFFKETYNVTKGMGKKPGENDT